MDVVADFDLKSYSDVAWNLKDQFVGTGNQLVGFAMVIGLMGALLYVAVRVWGHIARAEEVDVYPLLRPFAIGLVIMFFPAFVGGIDAAFKPLRDGTILMADERKAELESVYKRHAEVKYQKTKDEAKAVMSEPMEFEGDILAYAKMAVNKLGKIVDIYTDWGMDKVNTIVQQFVLDIARWCFDAASLCINVMGVFALMILSIFGPISFGFAIWDGLSSSMVGWITRYLNISLWFPIANVLRRFLIELEIYTVNASTARIETSQAFATSDEIGILIFYIMGIACFFVVPTIASWIISGGGNNNAIGSRAMSLATGAAGLAGTAAAVSAGVPVKALANIAGTSSASSHAREQSSDSSQHTTRQG